MCIFITKPCVGGVRAIRILKKLDFDIYINDLLFKSYEMSSTLLDFVKRNHKIPMLFKYFFCFFMNVLNKTTILKTPTSPYPPPSKLGNSNLKNPH